ncbi:MAG: DUF2892 domain-containing protein [Gemmatimonadales bacterium]|jgi:hypothetical protein
MAFRSGIYIVPTDSWYIERSVWLTAGFVLLASTILAWLVEPLVVLMIIVTGLVSIATGLTGFDPVGNVFHRLGFLSKLSGDPEGTSKWYRIRTDKWYLERRIYVAVGINISIASVLSLVHSPWWLAFTGFVGGAMVWFAATGFCIMANGLYWIGAEPRLAPEEETAQPNVPPVDVGEPVPQR